MKKKFLIFFSLVFFLSFVFVPSDGIARVGGGNSYSGSSRSSGGSGSSGGGSYGGGSYGGGYSGGSGGDGGAFIGELIYFFFSITFRYPWFGIPFDIFIIWIVWKFMTAVKSNDPWDFPSGGSTWEPSVSRREIRKTGRLSDLREIDPNFSELLFTDFTYALFSKIHEARGKKTLETYSAWLDQSAMNTLTELTSPRVTAVKGIMVGASKVEHVSSMERENITIEVSFQANYTEDYGDNENSFFTQEVWQLTRKRDVLSKPPEKITLISCPNCGGTLERKQDGSCAQCGVQAAGGKFDWFVTGISIEERTEKGPLLTTDVEEVGTDDPDVTQPGFSAELQKLEALDPEFKMAKLNERARYVFKELQDAWSSGKWERARPFETDNLFQTHLYWMNAYRKQHLKNVLEQIQITSVRPVKISLDPFYDGVTFRIHASMVDYTVDGSGNLVKGDRKRARAFSEYWTFIRRRGIKAANKTSDGCPSCGAPLKINMAGTCEFCQSKITTGEFDWVLSMIYQDDDYTG